MTRNSFFRTDKFSLLLFGTGGGLLSLASATYAQTSAQPPAVVLRQAEGMVSDCEIDLKESVTQDGFQLRLRLPDSISSIEVMPSASSNRSFRIRMDDPDSASQLPAVDSPTAGLDIYNSPVELNSARTVRSPMSVMAETDWKNPSRDTDRENVAEIPPAGPFSERPLTKSNSTRFKLNPFFPTNQVEKASAAKLPWGPAAQPITADEIAEIQMVSLDTTEENSADSPATAKVTQVVEFAAPTQSNRTPDSIAVDSVAFEQNTNYSSKVRSADGHETELQSVVKFPPKYNSLQTSDGGAESIQARSNPFVSNDAAIDHTITTEPNVHANERFAHMQVAASMELNRFASMAIPTTTQTPIPIASPLGAVENAAAARPPVAVKFNDGVAGGKSFSVLEPIAESKPVAISASGVPIREFAKSFASEPAESDRTTEPALDQAPVAAFFTGPASLDVDQAGDYEIRVANKSRGTASPVSISLQLPESSEILVIEREAEIDDLERTLTWKIDPLASGQQERIRFRLKVGAAGEVNFPVTVSQDGQESQTVSQTTVIE